MLTLRSTCLGMPMRSSHQENHRRRHHPRQPMGAKVQLQPIGTVVSDSVPCSHHSLSRDISASGMRIEADRFYSPDTRLLLAIEQEGVGMLSITLCTGAVVWMDPLPIQGRCMLGIKFGDGDGSSSDPVMRLPF
jgi:hypothetical protein